MLHYQRLSESLISLAQKKEREKIADKFILLCNLQRAFMSHAKHLLANFGLLGSKRGNSNADLQKIQKQKNRDLSLLLSNM